MAKIKVEIYNYEGKPTYRVITFACGKRIEGFIDEKSKYRIKHYAPERIVIFTDTTIGNEHYNNTINLLKTYNIPYKERKARLDNSVRIMIDITPKYATYII